MIQSSGPWPFTTRRVYQNPDQSQLVWRSRDHRKSLGVKRASRLGNLRGLLCFSLWMPRQLNWWIGLIFALGSLLFILGSCMSLVPTLASTWPQAASRINLIFFAGSIPFTFAAYLQLFQAANASQVLHGRPQRPVPLIGWFPQDIGWLSCALQFPGTLLFNINTFNAMLPSLGWLRQDLKIWAPDALGSLLFLLSGYLAFIETCHAHWAWKPASLSWWVTFINLLGCIGFMISSLFAFVPPWTPRLDIAALSSVFTLLGAVGFLIGSLLMLPESAPATLPSLARH
ncbi:MAG: hypothetical protein IGQ88_03480 [Gloeomargaritaceae cyanobacterium C42_A2020_066]|nr:hypothetical protein [Gloeomargaritaceae cyanobacterium C42_A2020_066]